MIPLISIRIEKDIFVLNLYIKFFIRLLNQLFPLSIAPTWRNKNRFKCNLNWSTNEFFHSNLIKLIIKYKLNERKIYFISYKHPETGLRCLLANISCFYLSHRAKRARGGVVETPENFSTVGNWTEWGSAGRTSRDSATTLPDPFSARHCRACRALRPVERRPGPTRLDPTDPVRPPPLPAPLPSPPRSVPLFTRAISPEFARLFFSFSSFFFTIPAIQRNEKPRFIHERWIDSLFCPFRGQWSRPVIRYFGLRLFNRFSTDFFALAEADDPNCGRVRIFSLSPPLPSLPSMQRSIKWGFTTRSRCNSIYSRQSRTDNKFNG